MTKSIALALILTAAGGFCAEPSGRATYLGGTVATLKTDAGGEVLTADRDLFVFASQHATVQIPYARINLVEYGQEVSRRVVLAYVISPMFLLMKSRKHFITVGFRDETDKQQTMVLRVDKRFVRSALAILEARTGCSLQYQDDEARKFRRN
jgi:hypothetical protein